MKKYNTISALVFVSLNTFSFSFDTFSNIKLIDSLKQSQIIKSKEVEKVLKSIDRADFISYNPYIDSPQSIGFQATISAPHMHAISLELLKDHLKTAKKCLDIGSGSGYLTLAMRKLILQEDSIVFGIEHIPELVEISKKNIEKNHSKFIEEKKIIILEGDGRIGLKEFEKFNCIHVGAAAEEIPKELVEQLEIGGRMVIPVGKNYQEFLVVDKDEKGKIRKSVEFPVRYVPLTTKEKQLKN